MRTELREGERAREKIDKRKCTDHKEHHNGMERSERDMMEEKFEIDLWQRLYCCRYC